MGERDKEEDIDPGMDQQDKEGIDRLKFRLEQQKFALEQEKWQADLELRRRDSSSKRRRRNATEASWATSTR